MNRYKVHKQIGDGAYGSVVKATNKQSNEIVAIKRMKKRFHSWEECMQLREVKSLKKLNHPNIVKLKEVIRENDELFFVFEYMEGNLYELTKRRDRPFPEAKIRNIMFQVFHGLSHMHKHGFFHRDIKPENMLVKGDVIKIADFGLAREIRSRPPYTDYVSTRWYRAPEVLLHSTTYGSPIDIWACGCVIAELYMLRPLFPGNSEIDQLSKICSILGTPTIKTWGEGFRLADQMNYKFPHFANTMLSAVVINANNDCLTLLSDLMAFEPQRRPSCQQILSQYTYFQINNSLDCLSGNANENQQNSKEECSFQTFDCASASQSGAASSKPILESSSSILASLLADEDLDGVSDFKLNQYPARAKENKQVGAIAVGGNRRKRRGENDADVEGGEIVEIETGAKTKSSNINSMMDRSQAKHDDLAGSGVGGNIVKPLAKMQQPKLNCVTSYDNDDDNGLKEFDYDEDDGKPQHSVKLPKPVSPSILDQIDSMVGAPRYHAPIASNRRKRGIHDDKEVEDIGSKVRLSSVSPVSTGISVSSSAHEQSSFTYNVIQPQAVYMPTPSNPPSVLSSKSAGPTMSSKRIIASNINSNSSFEDDKRLFDDLSSFPRAVKKIEVPTLSKSPSKSFVNQTVTEMIPPGKSPRIGNFRNKFVSAAVGGFMRQPSDVSNAVANPKRSDHGDDALSSFLNKLK